MQVKVFVLVDQDGDYGVGIGAEEARDSYAENVISDIPVSSRSFEITLDIPTPAPLLFF